MRAVSATEFDSTAAVKAAPRSRVSVGLATKAKSARRTTVALVGSEQLLVSPDDVIQHRQVAVDLFCSADGILDLREQKDARRRVDARYELFGERLEQGRLARSVSAVTSNPFRLDHMIRRGIRQSLPPDKAISNTLLEADMGVTE